MSTTAMSGRALIRRFKILVMAATTCLATLGLLITGARPAGSYPLGPGYLLIAADGGAFTFGQTQFFGSMGGPGLNQPVVGGAEDPFLEGYWMVARDGGVFAFGSSAFFGSLPAQGIHVNNIVGMAATQPGLGYWMVGSDGGVMAFGDAPFRGSAPGLGIHINNVVGIAPTPHGGNYWLVGSDGGVMAFGGAPFFGSAPGLGIHINNIVGIAPTPDGGGYWLAGSDGGVMAFGNAGFFGSLPSVGIHPAKPVVAVRARPPLAVKVDPFAPSGSETSNWVKVSGSWQLQLSGASGGAPAGARVLGVEGLNVSQLGTLGFTSVSGTCDTNQPYFLLEARNSGGGTDQGSYTCVNGGGGSTKTFNPVTGVGGPALPAGDVVTSLDIVEPGASSALANIQVAGLTITDFRTFTQAGTTIG